MTSANQWCYCALFYMMLYLLAFCFLFSLNSPFEVGLEKDRYNKKCSFLFLFSIFTSAFFFNNKSPNLNYGLDIFIDLPKLPFFIWTQQVHFQALESFYLSQTFIVLLVRLYLYKVIKSQNGFYFLALSSK